MTRYSLRVGDRVQTLWALNDTAAIGMAGDALKEYLNPVSGELSEVGAWDERHVATVSKGSS